MNPADPSAPPPLRDTAVDVLSALPGDAGTVRRAAFHRLLDGSDATVGALVEDTGLPATGVWAALDVLVAAGTATVDESGEVFAVGGLSIVAAAHELLLGERAYWTWCAFDGIGIPAALGMDAEARTRCGHCGTRLDVPITTGAPPPDSPLVGWLPGQTCRNVQADFCPAANLFCTAEHLAAWRAEAGNPPGRSAPLADLAALGTQVWAEMRRPGGNQ